MIILRNEINRAISQIALDPVEPSVCDVIFRNITARSFQTQIMSTLIRREALKKNSRPMVHDRVYMSGDMYLNSWNFIIKKREG